uniref:MH2 domain-containing protein n=1 Tax=Rhabditophanes sp. KR3021 TaxID=114890 RepID=A0AC35TWW0_9BILA
MFQDKYLEEQTTTSLTSTDPDMWYDVEQFQLDHLNEVLQRLNENTLDDEIWGKLIIMEKTKRVAKAYLRKTTVIIDGGDDEFDGQTIGFNYFTNPDRDQQTYELRKKIADGIIIKMDNQGNVKGMARGSAPVIVQNWRHPKKHCIAEKLVRLQGKLTTTKSTDLTDNNDRIFKIFDMKKFKLAIERDPSETEEEVRSLLLKACLRIALVKDGRAEDPMETPCWFMLINLVALDMLKTKLPHIGDLNCLYGELGVPEEIASFKRSAMKEQIETSSKRSSQLYYECPSDEESPKNKAGASRKARRTISSSDDSEESNTETMRYAINKNNRFLKAAYSGSITDSSSGFASGTEKRIGSSKRSLSDLTKSIEDLKLNKDLMKRIQSPGEKVAGTRPRLEKNLFEPPKINNDYHPQQRQINSANAMVASNEGCQLEESSHTTNYDNNNVDFRYKNSGLTNNRKMTISESDEETKEKMEGKDEFDLSEALKNVDRNFDYLEDKLDKDELVDGFEEAKRIESDSEDMGLSSSEEFKASPKSYLSLDRKRHTRLPINKNWLQTLDRVRKDRCSKESFNRKSTITNSTLEVMNANCVFFNCEENEVASFTYYIQYWPTERRSLSLPEPIFSHPTTGSSPTAKTVNHTSTDQRFNKKWGRTEFTDTIQAKRHQPSQHKKLSEGGRQRSIGIQSTPDKIIRSTLNKCISRSSNRNSLYNLKPTCHINRRPNISEFPMSKYSKKEIRGQDQQLPNYGNTQTNYHFLGNLPQQEPIYDLPPTTPTGRFRLPTETAFRPMEAPPRPRTNFHGKCTIQRQSTRKISFNSPRTRPTNIPSRDKSRSKGFESKTTTHPPDPINLLQKRVGTITSPGSSLHKNDTQVQAATRHAGQFPATRKQQSHLSQTAGCHRSLDPETCRGETASICRDSLLTDSICSTKSISINSTLSPPTSSSTTSKTLAAPTSDRVNLLVRQPATNDPPIKIFESPAPSSAKLPTWKNRLGSERKSWARECVAGDVINESGRRPPILKRESCVPECGVGSLIALFEVPAPQATTNPPGTANLPVTSPPNPLSKPLPKDGLRHLCSSSIPYKHKLGPTQECDRDEDELLVCE